MSPISATRTAPGVGPMPGIFSRRGVPRLLGHPAADDAGEHGDLEVDVVQQPAKRRDPCRVRRWQIQPVQHLGASHAEQVAHQHLDPALGEHGMYLGFAVGAQADEFGPVPH